VRNGADERKSEKDERPAVIKNKIAENWCRIKGHPPECNCVYPHPSEIVPMRGGLPGTRPMPSSN
jgi:hypothetical protein